LALSTTAPDHFVRVAPLRSWKTLALVNWRGEVRRLVEVHDFPTKLLEFGRRNRREGAN
jgi:hypothetical protein